jgi:hypothetical protein
LANFSEGTYFSYLRNRKKFNEKGELEENGIYEIKVRKSMSEYQSCLILLDLFKKNKLISRRRFTYNEELKSTEIIEKH